MTEPGKRSRGLLAVLAAAAFLAGCAPGAVVIVSPRYNPQQVRRVALMSFPDYPQVAGSGEIVASIFDKYLLWANYGVVERGQVDQILKEQSFDLSGAVDQFTIHNIGKLLGVDALILGNITSYANASAQTVMVDMPREHSDPIFGQVTTTQRSGGSFIRTEQPFVTGYATSRTDEVVPETQTQPARVGIAVRLVGVETGEVFWSGSAASDGGDPSAAAEQASAALMQQLVKSLRNSGKFVANP